MNITIQIETHNARKLVVEGLIQKDSSIWPPTADDDYQFYPTVTRHEVEWLIKDAINKGWDYSAVGPNFILQASNEVFGIGYLADQITKMKAESEKHQLNQEG